MVNPTATISMSDQDMALIKERHLSPSKIFRRAMYMLRAQQFDIEAEVLIDPVTEIVKLRNALAAQNVALKEAHNELKALKAERVA